MSSSMSLLLLFIINNESSVYCNCNKREEEQKMNDFEFFSSFVDVFC